MTKLYEPRSTVLKALAAKEDLSDASYLLLIAFTTDADRSNRDWATMVLAQSEVDTNEVRSALLVVAQNDDDDVVRAEAILGLAQRGADEALTLVQDGLRARKVSLPMFEAAALLAHPSLVSDLRAFAEASDSSLLDEAALDALKACEGITRQAD